LPGLIDSHVHLCGDSRVGALDRLADYDMATLESVILAGLRAQLAAGVTTVRDLGDREYAVLDWRETARAAGTLVAFPTVVVAGPPITVPGGHCWNMGGAVTGAELRSAVRERAERQVDAVKVMMTGGVMTPGTDVMACQFTEAELRVMVEEAHECGLPITAHAHGLPAVEWAVRAGVDGIEHCTCLTPTGIQMSDGLAEAMARAGIVVAPTLGTMPGMLPSPALLAVMEQTGMTMAARERHTAEMHHAGVRVVCGSDSGIGPAKPHGAILPVAVASLVNGGISATDALATATSVSASACGLGDRKGRLRAGYDADMVVVPGNPTVDIAVLGHVTTVYLGGAEVSRPSPV
jgi:imidazolonepropionase-like amidohydrolase